MIFNYDVMKFICGRCADNKHAECPGEIHCDCQHREQPKNDKPAKG